MTEHWIEFLLASYVVVHVACGIYDFGRAFAYFQRRFLTIADEDYLADFIFCFVFALTGPLAIFSSWVSGIYDQHYGFKWR